MSGAALLDIAARVFIVGLHVAKLKGRLEALTAEGLARKLRVNLGHLVGVNDGAPA